MCSVFIILGVISLLDIHVFFSIVFPINFIFMFHCNDYFHIGIYVFSFQRAFLFLITFIILYPCSLPSHSFIATGSWFIKYSSPFCTQECKCLSSAINICKIRLCYILSVKMERHDLIIICYNVTGSQNEYFLQTFPRW